ncbi:Ubiquitin-conjugating enzyme E2 15 [Mycoemilia scoparia]|uniref:Ubiquitin-conjugating enzyme E2 15 n=1 Tax=Mycoemilia scoparia TaxID=417184 RepID=A0A9W8DSI6_9FUNG|nr:Ubiquitin-conjugating enzyme E2 15 [Mycoemilia scoparia]
MAKLRKKVAEKFSVGIINDNIYEWEVSIFGLDDPYEQGIFKARLTFPATYPLLPPKFKFISEMWHPNVYESGDVCISILNPPGEDAFGYYHDDECWTPVLDVEKVIMCVISLLDRPEPNSPANLNAAIEFRNDIALYKKKVRRLARRTIED